MEPQMQMYTVFLVVIHTDKRRTDQWGEPGTSLLITFTAAGLTLTLPTLVQLIAVVQTNLISGTLSDLQGGCKHQQVQLFALTLSLALDVPVYTI